MAPTPFGRDVNAPLMVKALLKDEPTAPPVDGERPGRNPKSARDRRWEARVARSSSPAPSAPPYRTTAGPPAMCARSAARLPLIQMVVGPAVPSATARCTGSSAAWVFSTRITRSRADEAAAPRRGVGAEWGSHRQRARSAREARGDLAGCSLAGVFSRRARAALIIAPIAFMMATGGQRATPPRQRCEPRSIVPRDRVPSKA